MDRLGAKREASRVSQARKKLPPPPPPRIVSLGASRSSSAVQAGPSRDSNKRSNNNNNTNPRSSRHCVCRLAKTIFSVNHNHLTDYSLDTLYEEGKKFEI